MLLPANAVKKANPDWQIDLYKPGAVQIGSDSKGRPVAVKGLHLDGLDLMVMQRIGKPPSLALMRWALDRGIAITTDADDALWAIHRDNRAWRSWNGGESHWRYMDEAAELADLTTVTTDGLARRYAKHGRVEVLPNWVPVEVFDYPSARDRFDDRVALGWTGFTKTHPGDLRVVGNAVRDVIERSGGRVRARVIADGPGAAKEWGIGPEHMDAIASQPLGADYFTAITTIDIGLVPLAPGPFNRCKSSLKALEFSAMGVPVVCTPTPANKELGKDLPLLFASTPNEWFEHITRLAEDPDERHDRGHLAREVVQESWTMEGNAHRWSGAWERAVARREKVLV